MNTERLTVPDLFNQPPFNGSDYDPVLDDTRLTGQLQRIYDLMKDGSWRSLSEIAQITGDHEASISAQLRHLRKEKHGAHTVLKRRRGMGENGFFEYQLIINNS
jgi:DNA-binding CsgD family transcriptional regulator